MKDYLRKEKPLALLPYRKTVCYVSQANYRRFINVLPKIIDYFSRSFLIEKV